jgi:tRNA threonylcarbamoyladenosine biosynthesis protein TsaE
MLTFHLPDQKSTEELGAMLASALPERSIIALTGPLGAGKTTFAKGVANGLNVSEVVSSPTFTMLNEYVSGRIPLYHLDLYRLRETGELAEGNSEASLEWLAAELEELLEAKGVILIEWANFFDEWMRHQDYISVELNYSTNQSSTNGDKKSEPEIHRSAVISGLGPRSLSILSTLPIV